MDRLLRIAMQICAEKSLLGVQFVGRAQSAENNSETIPIAETKK
jgi:hypothetical protein